MSELAVEITPEIKALLRLARRDITASCMECCTGKCDCGERSDKLSRIFELDVDGPGEGERG